MQIYIFFFKHLFVTTKIGLNCSTIELYLSKILNQLKLAL